MKVISSKEEKLGAMTLLIDPHQLEQRFMGGLNMFNFDPHEYVSNNLNYMNVSKERENELYHEISNYLKNGHSNKRVNICSSNNSNNSGNGNDAGVGIGGGIDFGNDGNNGGDGSSSVMKRKINKRVDRVDVDAIILSSANNFPPVSPAPSQTPSYISTTQFPHSPIRNPDELFQDDQDNDINDKKGFVRKEKNLKGKSGKKSKPGIKI